MVIDGATMYEQAQELDAQLRNVEDKALSPEEDRRAVKSLLREYTPQLVRGAYKGAIAGLTGLALATGVGAQGWLYGCPKTDPKVELTGKLFEGIDKTTLDHPVIQEWVASGFADRKHPVIEGWIGNDYQDMECVSEDVFDAYKTIRGRRDAIHQKRTRIPPWLIGIILQGYAADKIIEGGDAKEPKVTDYSGPVVTAPRFSVCGGFGGPIPQPIRSPFENNHTARWRARALRR